MRIVEGAIRSTKSANDQLAAQEVRASLDCSTCYFMSDEEDVPCGQVQHQMRPVGTVASPLECIMNTR
jgi:hypothetical protein